MLRGVVVFAGWLELVGHLFSETLYSTSVFMCISYFVVLSRIIRGCCKFPWYLWNRKQSKQYYSIFKVQIKSDLIINSYSVYYIKMYRSRNPFFT